MVKFCVRCTISSMRPRISFDDEGVCSACRFAERKNSVNWDSRAAELKSLCDQHRKGNGDFDVIVPVSGGKDGGFVAHQLKTVYGMTPLCVTWAPLLPTEIGRKNLDAFVEAGFDVVQGRPNGQTTRRLTRLAFEHMGDPFQPFIYGQTNFPLQMAVRYQIPLIMYGEDGEAEYGGAVKDWRAKREIEDHDAHYFSGKPPEFWRQHGISDAQLKPFEAPGVYVAFWRSRNDGTPANHSSSGKPVKAAVGVVHEVPGPLELCSHRALHATRNPGKWKGERWWVVALHEPVQHQEDKSGALKRTILLDLGACPFS